MVEGGEASNLAEGEIRSFDHLEPEVTPAYQIRQASNFLQKETGHFTTQKNREVGGFFTT